MSKSLRFAILVSLVFCFGLTLVTLEAQNALEGSFQRTLDVSGPVDLDVSTGAGHIEIRPGSFGQVQVRALILVRNRSHQQAEELMNRLTSNPPIEQTGNTIKIGKIDNPDLRRDVSINYEITVPVETQVRSRTGSGDQTVAGIVGPANTSTGTGGINISDVQAGVHAETGSGSIRITNVRGDVYGKTGSGDIVAQNIGGGFQGSTGSGSVRFTQSAPGDVDLPYSRDS